MSKTAGWLRDAFRNLYPFIVCLFGGLFLVIDGVGWAGPFIAGVCFFWALDLAAERASAKATSETAAKFAAMMLSGEDTEISININHSFPANHTGE